MNNTIRIATIVSIIFATVMLMAAPINPVTSDLGRHLTTGKLVWQDPAVLTTNFYSLTNPTFPVVNHHWLSGVVFYGINRLTAFWGLSIFTILLTAITLVLMLDVSGAFTGSLWPLVTAVVSLPLITNRPDVRPELFSYFFIAAFLRILQKNTRLIWLLPVLELAWVNLHIYFPAGIGLFGLWLFIDLKKRNTYVPAFIATVAATFINPNFVRGALEPFTILTNYAYPLLENRPLWAAPPSMFPFVGFAYPVLILSVYAVFQKSDMFRKVTGVLLVVFGCIAIRNLPLVGYGALLLSAQIRVKKTVLYVVIGVCTLLTIVNRNLFLKRPYGLGLSPHALDAATFIRSHHITGPIFNNYDIGGYLIYTMFPDSNVFIDNRPEAYPASFITRVYIPMQEGSFWQSVDKQYGFRAIIWAKSDVTPWGRLFLAARRRDPAWHRAFENTDVVIFTVL